MLDETVHDAIHTLRRLGGEPSRIEAKSARGGLPRSARETLSAFSNTNGGLILLGVDEESGFASVPLPDPHGLLDSLVQMARDDIEPALQIDAALVDVDGHLVIAAEVPLLTGERRPAYVKAAGISTGSYIRGGDGDRRMTEAEIALVIGARTQPRHDVEPVPGTTADGLDKVEVSRTLARVRADAPRTAHVEDATLMHRIGITAGPDADAPLTLAGLLTFGEFPQQHFPQLMVSVVVHAPETTSGTRFLDNRTIRGPIPDLVDTALTILRRNLANRANINEFGRTDEVEYPLEAVREALVNALLHRDYSPTTRGTQVQVDLYPDRLTIRSPGGLYGGIHVEDLGEVGVSSSRNATLASLLSDTYLPRRDELVAENRASGIPAMVEATRRRGLPRPSFTSTIARFDVTLRRSELLSPNVREWIVRVCPHRRTELHELALALMRTGYVTNAMLREYGADRIEAGNVLRDLVDRGLALRENSSRRYAQYVLDPSIEGHVGPEPLFPEMLPSIESVLRSRGAATAAEIAAATGLSRSTVSARLRDLMSAGKVTAEGAPRSPRRSYIWNTTEEQP